MCFYLCNAQSVDPVLYPLMQIAGAGPDLIVYCLGQQQPVFRTRALVGSRVQGISSSNSTSTISSRAVTEQQQELLLVLVWGAFTAKVRSMRGPSGGTGFSD